MLATELFKNTINLQINILSFFNMDLFSTINALSMHMIDIGNFQDAEFWVAKGLEWYAWIYSINSPVLGLHYLIYGKLLWKLEKSKECILPLEKGISILKNSHGSNHPLIKESSQIIKDAMAELNYLSFFT